jgi:hypothetical protein
MGRRSPFPEAALGLGLVAAAIASRRLQDFDLPWHLAFGRQVWQTRSFPRVDDLAETHFPIKYAEIVSDLIFYATHALGGPLGLQILGGVFAAAIALLVGARARAAGVLAYPAAALAIAAIGTWLIVRPATLAFALFSVGLLLVEEHRRQPGTRAGRLALAGIVLLQIVWGNVHQSGSIGAAIAVGYLAYRAIARVARGRLPALIPPRDGVDLGATAIAVLLALVGTTFNRGGIGYFPNPFAYAGLAPFATEWATTSLALLAREPLAAGTLAAAVAAISFGRDPETGARTPHLFDLGLTALALAMSVYFRLLPMAILLIVPIAARRLAFVARYRGRTFALACRLSALAAAPVLFWRSPDPPGVGFLPRHFPEGAVRYIERTSPSGPMWNFSPFGGYLEWRLYPRYRPLIDGRIFDVAWAARVNQTEFDARAFEQLVAERKLELAVCRAAEGERFCVPPSELAAWVMVYWDDESAVYVREGGPNARLAAEGYRIFKHLDAPGDILSGSLQGPDVTEKIAHDGELALAQAPNSRRAVFLGACAALARNDEAALEARISKLAELAPGHPSLEALAQARAIANRRRAR